MGSAIQKVLQGRGDKKGKGIVIKASSPFILLFFLWLGLFVKFPLTKPLLWFPFAIFLIVLYFILYSKKRDKVYSFGIFFSGALLIAGVIQASEHNWLHILYLLYLMPLTKFYRWQIVIPISLVIPLLEIRHFIEGGNLSEEAIFNLTVILSVGMVSVFISGMNKKKDELESELLSMKDDAANPQNSTETGSIKYDEAVSQYLSSMAKADEEIKEVLFTIKHAILADTVSLFISQSNNLRLRCSTDETQNVIPAGEGLIVTCFKERRKIISSNISEKGYEVGYLKKGRISSFIALPIIDEPVILGVLTADSSRFSAFNDSDSHTLELFSKQLIRIFQKERVYSQIHRSHTGLSILHEESSKLASSLKLDILAHRLIESCYRIAPSSIVFLLKRGDVFEISRYKGNLQLEKTLLDSKGTLLDMAKKDITQPLYFSDVRDYNLPIMPFRTKDVNSVFMRQLVYENELVGVLVFLSEKLNAFNPHQIELLGVLGTQASISISNARLHSEIEKMAIVDGLTGLFNHRHFQERLSSEFRRRERSSEPFSLLLIDIDNFKKVNDTYGHPVGDKILQGVARILRDTLRNIDIPARYGGEEFAAILLSTDSSGARNMAERLRRIIMGTAFNIAGKGLQVTVSIGIATFGGVTDKKENLIERADRAMYHAKKIGKNKSVLWSDIRE